MTMPPERRLLPGHTDESTIGREWEHNPFVARLARRRARGQRARDASAGRDATLDRLEPRLRRQRQGLGALRRRHRRDRRRLEHQARLDPGRPEAPALRPTAATSAKPTHRTCPKGRYRRRVRLIVARCEVTYTGRLNAFLPESTRLLMIKADGSVLVHADAGGFKPLNWMTPPVVLEDGGDLLVVRKRAGRSEDRLEIRLLEVLSDVEHEMGEAAGAREGRRRARPPGGARRAPEALAEGLRLVQREWPTDIGPVDLMCRDEDGGWVAVEIKRVGTIDAVEQLTPLPRADPPRPGESRAARASSPRSSSSRRR